MKKIKSYNKFLEDSRINEEEGIKDWALGLGLAASALNPFSGKAAGAAGSGDVSLGKDAIEASYGDKDKDKDKDKDTRTIYRDIKSGSEKSRLKQAENLQKQGWTLDSVSVDTLWTEVIKQKPDTIVTVHDFKFNVDENQFASGSFQLNPEVVEDLNAALDSIRESGGVITDFVIMSGTDREPISMSYGGKTGNEALAQRRADALSSALISEGVDPSLIGIDISGANGGPDVYRESMTKKEREAARIQTEDFRFVTLSIAYFTSEVRAIPGIVEKIPKLKSTYHLSKEVGEPSTVKIKHKRSRPEKKRYIPVRKKKDRSCATRCADWGPKNAWWKHLPNWP